MLNHDGIKPDPQKIRAIQEIRAPANTTDVVLAGALMELGMANNLSRFIPNLAAKTEPLRQLPLKDSEWVWGPAQIKALPYLKNVISSPKVMAN